MASSCPYCGAALKLKFCVVCGRQSKINKMGNVRSTARNNDVTVRLEDPFLQDEAPVHKSLRFKTGINPAFTIVIGLLIAAILIFCAAKETFNIYTGSDIDKFFKPLMKSYHVHFPRGWPENLQLEKRYKTLEGQKSNKSSKHHNKSALR